MMCQNCGENEANVKYTQIINGVKKQMNLCENCARKLGVYKEFSIPKMHFTSFFEDMLNNDLFEFGQSLIRPNILLRDRYENNFEQLGISDKFWNEELNDDFSEQMKNLIKSKNKKDIGYKETTEDNKKENEKDTKIIGEKQKNEAKLVELKKRLEQEIKEERYEDAAKTRDEIKKRSD